MSEVEELLKQQIEEKLPEVHVEKVEYVKGYTQENEPVLILNSITIEYLGKYSTIDFKEDTHGDLEDLVKYIKERIETNED